MDIHDFNPSRRRFLTGMLAVGAASALAAPTANIPLRKRRRDGLKS